MRKVVILTGRNEVGRRLIRCLEALFPDCEIEIKNSTHGGAADAEHAAACPREDDPPANDSP